MMMQILLYAGECGYSSDSQYSTMSTCVVMRSSPATDIRCVLLVKQLK